MSDQERTSRHAAKTLARLWPRIQATLAAEAAASPAAWKQLAVRVQREWPRLFGLLVRLYAGSYDLFYHMEQLLTACARSALGRPGWLAARDAAQEAEPGWFQRRGMLGGVIYVDLFAGTLRGVQAKIPYFKELGLTYLHLMPLFAAPEGDSDGGYAVSSYRDVRPDLGTIADLRALAEALHAEGIALVVDFVFNHTSDEHAWARGAQREDPELVDFYYLYPDRSVPDQYQRTLREIFPTVRRGSFTWREDMQRWVWTTFNSFQWDLNYANPAVFCAMAEELLFLANAGVAFLRLDAVAFIWKRMGTDCENQPEAHLIIQAYNAVCRIAAPSLLFKSEAIVHPDEVLRYISPEECQISYNPLTMALLWEALATRDVKLLSHSLATRFRLPAQTAWVNYLRSHDDIGWTFDDEDARRLGIDSYGHRRFLNNFYIGRFPGSFAGGVPFQENPDTGDARVSGTLAALTGLERAANTPDGDLQNSIRRVLLLHSVILSLGGVPLLYLGDEIGTPNDYSYIQDPAKANDSRWVHRPHFDWQRAERRTDPRTLEGQIFAGLHHLIELRKSQPAFEGVELEVLETGNGHVLGYARHGGGQRIVCLANFTERPQPLDGNVLRVYGPGYHFRDLVGGAEYTADLPLTLAPYAFVWVQPFESV